MGDCQLQALAERNKHVGGDCDPDLPCLGCVAPDPIVARRYGQTALATPGDYHLTIKDGLFYYENQ